MGLLLLVFGATAARASADQGGGAPRRLFPQSVRTVSEDPSASGWHVVRRNLSEEELAVPVDFQISLQMGGFADLQRRLETGERIPASEMEAKYLPAKSDYDRVVGWLKANGISISMVDRNHTTVYARASTAQVALVLGTTFARAANAGAEVTTAISAPSLPSSIAGPVLGVSGLQPNRRIARVQPKGLTAQFIPGPYGWNCATPAIFAANYDFPASLDGTGQTIALVEDSVSNISEFAQFWSAVGSSQKVENVSYVLLQQQNNIQQPSNPEDEPETALDVEWAGALAPGASIRIYVHQNIVTAVGAVLNDLPAHPGMRVLSISYAGLEEDAYQPGYAQTFAQLAAAGVTVVAAAGENDLPRTPPIVSYPASDPNVTGIGGIRTWFSPAGLDEGDNVFTGDININAVEMSGPSSIFPVPSWQSAALASSATYPGTSGIHTADITGRWVPDVAAFANGETDQGFNTFAYVVDTYGVDALEGTEVSTAIWAGVAALMNQERARIGGAPMGCLNPLLYPAFDLYPLKLPPPLVPTYAVIPSSTKYFVNGPGLGRPDVSELISCLADNFYVYTDNTAAGIVANSAATLNGFSNSPNTAFQWQVNNGSGWVNLVDGSNPGLASGYLGSASPHLTVIASSGYTGGLQYRAVGTNSLGATAATAAITLSLASPLAGFTVSSNGNGTGNPVPLGARLGVGVIAPPGNDDYSYQWELNGVPIPGATEEGFSAASATAANAGYYSVVVTSLIYTNLSTTINIGYVNVVLPSTVYHLTLLAGGATGFADGPGAAAQFEDPGALAVDSQGNVLVSDAGNYAIRKISPSGATSTLAGNGSPGLVNGISSAAEFAELGGLAVDSAGNVIVVDGGNSVIRLINPAGVVSTLAGSLAGYVDGPAATAEFYAPTSLAIDSAGNIEVADFGNQRVRTVTPAGQVSTRGKLANGVRLLAVDSAGDIYVTDYVNPPEVDILAPGAGPVAWFGSEYFDYSLLTGIAVDRHGNVFLADRDIGVTFIPAGGLPQEVIGDNGANLSLGPASDGGSTGGLNETLAVATDSAGNFYFSQGSNNGATSQIFKASPAATVSQPAPAAPTPAGTPVTMTVTVTGSYATSTFQWEKNGLPIPGATGSTLAIPSPGATDRGVYSVVWTNEMGTVTLGAGTLDVAPSDARLINLSARAQVGTGANVLISGFAVGGDSQSVPKNIVVTGKGPFLQHLGVSGALTNPTLTLFDGQSNPIAVNVGWGNTPVMETGAGASPLTGTIAVTAVSPTLIADTAGTVPATGSADSMLAMAAPVGSFTSIVSGANGGSGVGLTEVFDADMATGNGGNSARLINISGRSYVGTGGSVLIAGFAVAAGPSGAPETVMIRGQGPNLETFGLVNALLQPRVTLYDGTSAPIASNTGWQTSPVYATGAGASPLAAGSIGLQAITQALQFTYAGNVFAQGAADSGMLVTLPPGNYTVILDGVGGTTGVGLIELYEVR